MKKRKLVMQLTSALADEPAAREDTTATVKQGPPNDIEKFLSLRKQVKNFLWYRLIVIVLSNLMWSQ